MATSALRIATTMAVLSAAVVPPAFAGLADNAASTRLTLQLTNTSANDVAHPEITVAGRNGTYDRVETTALGAALGLSAQPADAGAFKIVRSRLALTTKNTATEEDGVDTLGDAVPSTSLASHSVYNLPIALDGAIAHQAIAMCNAALVSDRDSGVVIRRTMTASVAWRITTGNFAFKWTNYDRVAPSGDILRNPDFYADQETQITETPLDVIVACAPLVSAPVAASPAGGNPVRRVASTSEPLAQPTQHETAREVKVSQFDGGKPRCDGGMVRQVSTTDDNYVCLCPGNTTRSTIGDNAFVCERRFRK